MSPRFTRPAPRRPARRRARDRGFTLVELIIAMAAGLAVAAAAVLLARNASRFFQHEARMSSAHLAAVLGMNRLTTDLQRAAFLSTPNLRADPNVCGTPGAWPDGVRKLAGITLVRNGSVGAHPAELVQSMANSMQPDAVVIGGTFNTTEQFAVRAIIPGVSGGFAVYLHTQGEAADALRRTLQRLATPTSHGLDVLFRQGRILRVIAPGQSKYMYGLITGLDVIGTPNAPNEVVVRLGPNPALPFKENGCGIGTVATVGAFANPIARVKYDIRSVASYPTYAPLVAPISPEVTGDDRRTELVRVELDGNNQEIDSTLELVAEYAVDLKFGISVASPLNDSSIDPVVTRYPIQVPELSQIYNITDENTGTPHVVRSVQVRLSTRTRAPDRDTGLATGADGRPLRFFIPGIGGMNSPSDVQPGSMPVYARMRTLYAEVSLPNHVSAQVWPP